MNEDDHGFVDEAVRDLARAVEEGLEEHPDPDTLLAHHRGKLSPQEAAVVEDHLLWCRDCASFGRHTPVPEEDLGPQDPDRAGAEWERLRRRLASERGTGEGAGPRRRGPATDPEAASRRPYPLARAAVIAVALLAAGVWIGHLATETGTPNAPQPNVRIVDLAPRAADREGGIPPQELSADTYAVLVLNARLPGDAGTYEARFVDAAGRTAHTVGDLVPAEYGNLHIGLPPGAIAPGTYRLELLETGSPQPFETFQVRVLEPAP